MTPISFLKQMDDPHGVLGMCHNRFANDHIMSQNDNERKGKRVAQPLFYLIF
jgi:hypothetical protein